MDVPRSEVQVGTQNQINVTIEMRLLKRVECSRSKSILYCGKCKLAGRHVEVLA